MNVIHTQISNKIRITAMFQRKHWNTALRHWFFSALCGCFPQPPTWRLTRTQGSVVHHATIANRWIIRTVALTRYGKQETNTNHSFVLSLNLLEHFLKQNQLQHKFFVFWDRGSLCNTDRPCTHGTLLPQSPAC